MLKIILEEYNCLFIGAHYDDIEIGCGGLLTTVNDLSKISKTSALIVSNSNKDIELKRKSITKQNLQNLNVKLILFNYEIEPLTFYDKKLEIKKIIEKTLDIINPDFIFFHSKDSHQDHIIINEIIHEIARPLSTNMLKGLIEFHIPCSENKTEFNYNYMYDQKYQNMKINMLKKYIEIEVLKEKGDRRTLEYINLKNKEIALFSGDPDFGEQYKLRIFR